MLGHWKLDEGSGTSASDSSGNQNHGTIYGASWVNGYTGKALSFDGTDDYVQILNEANFDFSNGDEITIEAWIKPTNIISNYNEIIVSKGQDDYPKHFRFYVTGTSSGSGKLGFLYWDTSNTPQVYSSSNSLISNNNWYQVSFSYTYGTGSSAKLYVGGNEVSGSWTNGNGNSASRNNNNPVMIGAEVNAGVNERFNGVIDEVKIYHIPGEQEVIVLEEGPHLFIDDYLIDDSSGIERIARISNFPRTKVVDGVESVEVYSNNRKWKPNAVSDWPVEVHYDPDAPADKKFRMWHETFLFDNHICNKEITRTMVYRTSSNGVDFSSPGTELNYDCESLAYAFSSVIDDKTDASDRFKTIYGLVGNYPRGSMPGMGAVSPDGIQWEFVGPITLAEYDEIWAPFWDPKYQRYGVLHRDYDPGGSRPRRYLSYGETADFYDWPASSVPFDVLNENGNFGETQYYGASNAIRRGDYLIAVKRILRDDLKADWTPDKINNKQWTHYPNAEFPVYGIGYSVLAWSRDGEVDANGNRVWHRDKPQQEYVKGGNILDGLGLYNDPNVFFAPDPNHAPQVADPDDPYSDSTPFDHAHAWIDTLLEMPAGVNGEPLPMVYMYYGGYKYGHKIYTDRSIGLVKIKKDRFVSRREWGNSGGSGFLETPWIEFNADTLKLNLDTAAGGRIGSVKLEVIKEDGSKVNCGTFSGIDEIEVEVTGCDIAQFVNDPIKFKFTISDAYLFAFYLESGGITTTTTSSTTTSSTSTTTTLPSTTTSSTTTTTQPTTTVSSTTSIPTTTTIPQTTTSSIITTTITSTTSSSTTTMLVEDLEIDLISCSENECTIDVVKNTLDDELVIFFELKEDTSGKIYYTANFNLRPGSTGEKKIIMSRIRPCPEDTQVTFLILTYRQTNLGYIVHVLRGNTFSC